MRWLSQPRAPDIFLHVLFAFLVHSCHFRVVKNEINQNGKDGTKYILLIVAPDAPADQHCKGTFGDVSFPLHKTLKPMSDAHFKKDANADLRSYKDVCSKCFEDSMKNLLAWAQTDRKMNTVSITVSNLYVAENELGKMARDPNKQLLEKVKNSVNHVRHSHNKKSSRPESDESGIYSRLKKSVGYDISLQSDADSCTDADAEDSSQSQTVVDGDDFDLFPDEQTTDGGPTSLENHSKLVSDRGLPEEEMLDQTTLAANEQFPTSDQVKEDGQSADYFDKISDFPVALSGDGLKFLEMPQFDNAAELDVPTSTQKAVQNDLSTRKTKHRHSDEPLRTLQQADDPDEDRKEQPLYALVPAIPILSSYDRQPNFLQRINAPSRSKDVKWIVVGGLGDRAGPKKRNKHVNKEDDEDLNSTTDRFRCKTTCSECDKFTLPKSTKKYLNDGDDVEVECATQQNEDANEPRTKKPWKPLVTTLRMLVTYKTVKSDLFTVNCKPQTTPVYCPTESTTTECPLIYGQSESTTTECPPIYCQTESTTAECPPIYDLCESTTTECPPCYGLTRSTLTDCSTSKEQEKIVEHLPSMGLPISHSGTQEERCNQHNFQYPNQADAKQDSLMNLITSLKDNFHHTFLDSMPLSPEGSPSAPSMLAMTQNLLNQMEAMPTANGYIASIRGGRVSDLKNCSSELVKSLHFITNLCDGDKTVLILTASCPENDCQLPFLVSGAEISNFDSVEELSDVPREIRAHIEGAGKQRNGCKEDGARLKAKKTRARAKKQNGRRSEHVQTSIERINQLFDSFPNGEQFDDELAASLVAPSDVWYSDIKIGEDADDDDLRSSDEHVVKRASSGCATYEMLVCDVMLFVIPVLLRQLRRR